MTLFGAQYFIRVARDGCEKIFTQTFTYNFEALPDGKRCSDGRTSTDLDTCVNGLCVSCPEPKTCTGVDKLSITLIDGTLVSGRARANRSI